MAGNLTESSSYDANVPQVSDGEDIDQTLLNQQAQALANRSKYLKDTLTAHTSNTAPHSGHVSHSLATAVNDFLVATGAGAFAKKTLAEVKSILGLGNAAYKNVGTGSGDVAAGVHSHNGGDLPSDGNWASRYAIATVAGMMAWKNYGNGHVIFDASQSTTPSGLTCNNTNSAGAWSPSYPTLMGWNGETTYGVRVDSARVADSATSASSANSAGTSTYAEYLSNENSYMRFHWNGQSGQPSWLWGGNESGNMYLWNPSNFLVAYAASAGNCDTIDGLQPSQLSVNYANTAGNATTLQGYSPLSFFINYGTYLSGNGYTRIGPLIIQWATGAFTTTGDQNQTIVFPMTFPNACLHLMVSTKAASNVYGDGWFQEISVSPTSCVVVSQWAGVGNMGNGLTPKILAIGY